MRRIVKSTLAAFGVGLFWAGAGTLAMMGAHHVWAPPTPESGLDGIAVSEHSKSQPVEAASAGVERWARQARGPDAAVLPHAASKVLLADKETADPDFRTMQRVADVEAQRALTRAIQQELGRVGCYAGAVDGTWSDGTRQAMTMFNRSVKTELPTIAPDYILLTMLQGFPTKACGQGQERTVTAARVPAVRDATADTFKQGVPSGGWSTNVVVPPAPRSASAVAPVAQVPAPVAGVKGQQHVLSGSAPELIGTPMLISPPQVLPGRMAVGAPVVTKVGPSVLPQEQQPTTAVPAAIDPASAAPVERQPRAAPVRARDVRVSNAAAPAPRRATSSGSNSDGGSRLQRTFSDLSRNAP